MKNKNNLIIKFKKNKISKIKINKFNFFNVDEKLNNEINKYTSLYSGENKEILEF